MHICVVFTCDTVSAEIMQTAVSIIQIAARTKRQCAYILIPFHTAVYIKIRVVCLFQRTQCTIDMLL